MASFPDNFFWGHFGFIYLEFFICQLPFSLVLHKRSCSKLTLGSSSLLAMAFVISNDNQFCDDINRVIYEEEMLMNSGSGDESRSEDLDLNPNMLIGDHPDPKPDEPPIAPPVLGKKQRVYDLKKKKQVQVYERYTCEQVKRMLEVFDKNPHPTEKERRALAWELELRHSQIKFWFQNHRSQTKKKHEKEENAKLREENEKLRADNEAMTISLNAARCNPCSCHVPGETSARRAEFLRAENDFLKDELSRVNNFVETCGNGKKPLAEAAGPSDVEFATSAVGLSNLGLASFGEMLGLPWNDFAWNDKV